MTKKKKLLVLLMILSITMVAENLFASRNSYKQCILSIRPTKPEHIGFLTYLTWMPDSTKAELVVSTNNEQSRNEFGLNSYGAQIVPVGEK